MIGGGRTHTGGQYGRWTFVCRGKGANLGGVLELLGPDLSNLTVDNLPLKSWTSCLVGLRRVLLGMVPLCRLLLRHLAPQYGTVGYWLRFCQLTGLALRLTLGRCRILSHFVVVTQYWEAKLGGLEQVVRLSKRQCWVLILSEMRETHSV
jgi:hypothetical protein